MMSRKLLFASLLLLTACTNDPLEPATNSGDTLPTEMSNKIVHTPDDAREGVLLVRFDDEAIERIEAAAAAASATRATMTRAGIDDVDAILDRVGTRALRRLFPYDARVEERTRAAGLHRWYEVAFAPDNDLEAVAQQLAAIAQVSTVQYDIHLKKAYDGSPARPLTSAAPAAAAVAASRYNDPLLAKQWHYHNVGDVSLGQSARVGADINLYEAWSLESGDPRIIVAVVDEGVKYTHPDLAANMWINPGESASADGIDDDGNGYVDDLHGYNFVTDGPISWDVQGVNDQGQVVGDSGHGTHVAGTVAAVNNNALGVSGVAGGSGNNDGVRIMSCQIFSGTHQNSGSASASALAVKYAADNGASILQCSWGYPATTFTSDAQFAANSSVEQEALQYFRNTKNCDALEGGLVIFAAGNDALAMSAYPGACADYISVTAFGPDMLPAYYTNYGPGCNIAAPGGEYYLAPDYASSMVLSTLPAEINSGDNPDYGYMQGTSMACPHVSGIAALGLSYALRSGKSYTLEEFQSMILTSVNDLYLHFNGTKSGAEGNIVLGNYLNQMGTGAIDACQLLLQIEGTPCLKAKVGSSQFLQLTSFFGGAAERLTYTGVTMSAEQMAKVGMTEAPKIQYGKLQLHCTKPGVARLTVHAIAGGSTVGGGNAIGGQAISKEFAIIARGVQTANGGWL